MTRTEIINFCIKKYNFKTYLEIGVSSGENIKNVLIDKKDGVDPGVDYYGNKLSSLVNFKMNSDQFFETIENDKIYDFIFIDGLHHHEQVDKDLENSFKHLSENGIIMLHDTMPSSYEAQVVPRIQRVWNGDVWKSVVKLRYIRNDLDIMTLDTDHGCTLIKKGSNIIYNEVKIEDAMCFNYFKENKIKLMNVVSIDFFEKNI